MRKWVFWGRVLCGLGAVFGVAAGTGFGQLSSAGLQRAKADVERIKVLVDEGTLPRSSLDQARERLADEQDLETLSGTLYSPQGWQDMSAAQGEAMVAAATRRAQALLEARQKLLELGIISQAELRSVKDEAAAREAVVELAKNRLKLTEELREMAATEQRMEMPTVRNSMIRYDGPVVFKLADLAGIEKAFRTAFHHDLPVSALGQTMVHQSMGLDHRDKVDVALNPEGPEGLWLRHYLEKAHVSYLAFRSAVAGAATAPHIHIGTMSRRLSWR